MNTTEKYIKKAVEEAKKTLAGNSISHCNFAMHMEADGATQTLADALETQANANKANSEAMLQLAKALKPIGASAVRIDSQNNLKVGE